MLLVALSRWSRGGEVVLHKKSRGFGNYGDGGLLGDCSLTAFAFITKQNHSCRLSFVVGSSVFVHLSGFKRQCVLSSPPTAKALWKRRKRFQG